MHGCCESFFVFPSKNAHREFCLVLEGRLLLFFFLFIRFTKNLYFVIAEVIVLVAFDL